MQSLINKDEIKSDQSETAESIKFKEKATVIFSKLIKEFFLFEEFTIWKTLYLEQNIMENIICLDLI